MADPQVKAIVSAEDRASATLRAIAQIAKQTSKELDGAGKGSRLAETFNTADLPAKKHLATIRALTGAFKELSGAALLYAGIKLPHLAKEAFKAGEQLQHAEVQLTVAGIPDAELAAARAKIAELQTTIPNVSTEHSLELWKEMRSVLQDVHEVPHLMEPMMRAKASLEAGGVDAHGLGFLVKGAELLGYAQDKAKFEHYIDSAVKASQVMGKLINPEQIFEIAKYEKASGRNLSERFQTTTALSLAQELGGSTLGKSIDQFEKTIVGAVNNHAALKVAADYGLINRDDIIWDKKGQAHGLKAGKGYVDMAMAQTDPDKWVLEKLAPALAKHGDTSDEAITAAVRKLFPAGGSADFVNKVLSQKESLANHAKLYEAAQGIKAVEQYREDFSVASKVLRTVAEDFAGVAVMPIMKPLASGVSDFTLWLSHQKKDFFEWQKAHPEEAKKIAIAIPAAGITAAIGTAFAGSKLLKSLLGGAALEASAVSLTGSAAALTEAAAALTGAAGVTRGANAAGAAVNAATGAAGTAATGAAGAAGGSLLGRLGTIALRGSAVASYAALAYAGVEAAKVYQGTPDAKEKPPENAVERWAKAVDDKLGTWGKPKVLTPDEKASLDKVHKLHVAMNRDLAEIHTRRRQRDALADIYSPSVKSAQITAPPTWANKQLAMPPAIASKPPELPTKAQEVKVDAEVHGDVQGEVKGKLDVKVDASPLLTTTIHGLQEMSGRINGQLTNSKLGRTMSGSNGAAPGIGSAGGHFGLGGATGH